MKILVLLIMGVWIGMLIGISFLEAPLKFQAPNITVPLGLGIGKLVFAALNRFEIVFSVILTIWLVKHYQGLEMLNLITIGLVIFIIGLQTFWLLPALAARAELVISGEVLSNSYHHIVYVLMEISKVLLLIFGFIKTYQYEGYSG